MRIAKAVIMAGNDAQERFWPSTGGKPRQLFPVANRPILFHHLERLRRAGLLEATILVDEQTRDPIVRAVGDGKRWNLTVHYDECRPDAGLPAALATCREFIADEPVIVQPADALLRTRLHEHINAFADDRLDAMALRVVPGAQPTPRELSLGYLLSTRALEVLVARADDAANPIEEVRASGGRVRVQAVEGCLPCHGDINAVLECNRRMLQELEGEPVGAELEDSEIQGPVVVDPSVRIRRSTVRGPAIIGPGARLSDAYVGPYTSIGAGVQIEGAEIEHSIVLPRAALAFVGTRIESSVIGEEARVARTFRKPSSLRMSIGAGAEVSFS
jgi:glucose-1-phosphate thymidylyltransferase